MKKSTILFTVLAVTAFLVATVLGLQNPNLPETENEFSDAPESAKDNTISNLPPENNELNGTLTYSSVKT